MHWDYGWGMGFGWVFMIFFWVLVVLGIVYFIRIVITGAKKETSGDTALDILKKRYAHCRHITRRLSDMTIGALFWLGELRNCFPN